LNLHLTTDEVIQIIEGEDLYSALKRAGTYLVASCGGKGICGKCKVKVIKGHCEIVSHGKLTEKERKTNIVLACQAIPVEDVLIDIPKESQLALGDKIAFAKTKNLFEYLKSYSVTVNPAVKRIRVELSPPTISDSIGDLERLERALDDNGLPKMRFSHRFISTMSQTLREANWKVEFSYVQQNEDTAEAISLVSPENYNIQCGIAVDIGTTTVVVYLVDLLDGDIIDIGSTYNSQMRYGDDVITRIIHATEGGGLQELRNAVVTDINTIVGSLTERHNIKRHEVEAVTIAGNTTMSQIFWGLNPASIREEPYIPTLNNFPLWKADMAHLSINALSPIYTVPCVASYVGGDIVAGVLASKMYRKQEMALFMDIGTNGEIVIGNDELLMTCACSAGPCFEGSGIRCGMRATSGAIESVKIDPLSYEPLISVIGDGKPLGICGSGMIDAISEMFLTGIIDQKGKYVTGKTSRVREGEDGYEYLFYRDELAQKEIVLTEVDIENMLRAKAAIYGGMVSLLNEVGLSLDAIERVYIAGGFGNYLNVERAIILGMLPDLPIDRFVFMGNTSIAGAYLCLLSEELRKEAEEIASRMTYIELSVLRRFMDEYLSALFLPHTDLKYFPTVAALMQR